VDPSSINTQPTPITPSDKTYTFDEYSPTIGDYSLIVTLNSTWEMNTIQRVNFIFNIKSNANYDSIYVRTIEAGFSPNLIGKFVVNRFICIQDIDSVFFIAEFYVDKNIWDNKDTNQLFSFTIDGWAERDMRDFTGQYDSSPLFIYESWTIPLTQSSNQLVFPTSQSPKLITWELREIASYFQEYVVSVTANSTWEVGTEQEVTITIAPSERFSSIGSGSYMKIDSIELGVFPNLRKDVVDGTITNTPGQMYTYSMKFTVDGNSYGVNDDLKHPKRLWFAVEGSTHFDFPLPKTANLFASDDWTVQVKGSAKQASSTFELPSNSLLVLVPIITVIIIVIAIILLKTKRHQTVYS
jgi:hypothetical protein